MEIITLKGGEVEVRGVPEVIRILPLGHVTSQKGEFDVDEESLRLMKAEIARHGVDVVVDYEHQTLDGVQAPAAGWVKELSIQDGHIVAKVEWTDRAAEYLKNREYRYLSPVITVRKLDGKATGLHSLALTNTPAIDHMDPIQGTRKTSQTGRWDWKRHAARSVIPTSRSVPLGAGWFAWTAAPRSSTWRELPPACTPRRASRRASAKPGPRRASVSRNPNWKICFPLPWMTLSLKFWMRRAS